MDILKLSSDLQCELIQELCLEADIAGMLTRIADQTSEVLRASACSIFTLDPGGRTATQRAGTGYQTQAINMARSRIVPADRVPIAPAPDEKLGLTGWIMSTGQSFLAETPEELIKHPHRSGEHDPEQLPGEELRLQTFLGVPLQGVRGEIIGLIKAERREGKTGVVASFSTHDQIVMQTMAQIASKCLIYWQMAQDGRADQAVTAWARDVIAEAAATAGELDSFLGYVVDVASAAMRADSCGIYLRDESRKTLTQRAGNGTQQPRFVIRSYPLPTPQQVENTREHVGVTSWIAATGGVVYARNYRELHAHPHHLGHFDRWNFPEETATICGAFLGIPFAWAVPLSGSSRSRTAP